MIKFFAILFSLFAVVPALFAESFRGVNFGILGSPLIFYDTAAKRNYSLIGLDFGYQFTQIYWGFQGNINWITDSPRTSPEKTECADGSLLFGYLFNINERFRFRPSLGGGISNRRYALDEHSKPYETYSGWHITSRGELLLSLLETKNSSLALALYGQITPRFFNKTNDELGFGLGFRLDYHVDIVSMFVDFADILKKLQRHRDTEKNTEK